MFALITGPWGRRDARPGWGGAGGAAIWAPKAPSASHCLFLLEAGWRGLPGAQGGAVPPGRAPGGQGASTLQFKGGEAEAAAAAGPLAGATTRTEFLGHLMGS